MDGNGEIDIEIEIDVVTLTQRVAQRGSQMAFYNLISG